MGGKYAFDDIPPEERRRIAEECGLTEEEARVQARANMRATIEDKAKAGA